MANLLCYEYRKALTIVVLVVLYNIALINIKCSHFNIYL